MEMQSPVPLQPYEKRRRSCSPMAIVNLVLRAFTFVLLFISFIILTTTSVWVADDAGDAFKVHFKDFYAYRYMLCTVLMGLIYSLMQTAFGIVRMVTGKLLSSGFLYFDFYADKFISYTLATGAAAAFGLAIDAKYFFNVDEFWAKTNASASLLLLSFVCCAVSSIFSSLALAKFK